MQWSDNFNESVQENLEELQYPDIAFSENLVPAFTETTFQLVAPQFIYIQYIYLQHNRSVQVNIKYRYIK